VENLPHGEIDLLNKDGVTGFSASVLVDISVEWAGHHGRLRAFRKTQRASPSLVEGKRNDLGGGIPLRGPEFQDRSRRHPLAADIPQSDRLVQCG